MAPGVAIVTGASSGIGFATARLLAKRGMTVLGAGRDRARLAALAEETGITPCSADLANPAAPDIIMTAARALGPVTTLVHSAGRPGYIDQSIFEQSLEGWRETMAVNLDAVFSLTRLAVHDMRAAGFGRIVIVSSTAGEVGGAAMAPYCASKHGVIGLMRAVAQDVGVHGITCNAVLPGWVKTPMAEGDVAQVAARRGITPEQVWAEYAAGYPAKRVLDPQEIAEVIGFLASPAASGLNGEAVTVALGGLW